MKKITILFVVALFAASAVSAQGVELGLKGGLNFANQKFEGSGFSISPDARTGFHGGAFLTLFVTDNFALQPEFLFSIQGSKFDFGGFGEISNTFNYVNIPILLRYNPVDIFNIHAGPQVGLLMSAVSEFDGSKEDIEGVKSSDIGFAFGAGVDLPLGLVGGVRYVMGLSNISEDSGDGESLKNNVFQIYVGYKLFSKKK